MKITEYKNEDALDLLAEIIEPSAEIFSDKKVQKLFSGAKTNKMEIVKHLLKEHKKSIICILATLDGKTVEEYNGNIITMTASILELLNDKEMISFFQSQGQMEE